MSPAGQATAWPTPLPKWVWQWMRWRLGEGEFKKHGPRKGPRPKDAPASIPPWGWERLQALLAQRAGEVYETPETPKPGPKPHPKPRPTPHQLLMAARRELADVWIDLARRPELGHYSQARPAEHDRDHVTLDQVRAGRHWTGDCSSTVGSWGPRLAGLDPAPSGVWTNTWRIAAEWIPVHMPALGDAALYRGHVCGVIGFRHISPTRDRDDVFVFSHGSEAGPYGWPLGELAAGYRDDFQGWFRHPSLELEDFR